MITSQPSFEHCTALNSQFATWPSSISSLTISTHPLSALSQRMFNCDMRSLTNLAGRNVCIVNGSIQVGHRRVWARWRVMHGWQKKCSFLVHCIGCLSTFKQIAQWKFSATGLSNRSSSYPPWAEAIVWSRYLSKNKVQRLAKLNINHTMCFPQRLKRFVELSSRVNCH